MDLKRFIAKTTKPVLVSSRSGSAASEMNDRRLSRANDESDKASPKHEGDTIKPTISTVTSVVTSVNKIKLIRQRTQAAKGNITMHTPMRKFNPSEVCREIDRILATTLLGVTYDPKRASVLSKSLSESIKEKVKTLKFPRYKFVALVTISSQSRQSMIVGSKCVWNADMDSFANGHYSNGSLVAVVTVFAVFKE